MDQGSIAQLIIEYRYWILLPLSFAEGPIVAFVAGALASLGYFNVFLLAIFFFFRDVIVDLIMYFIGYYGGKTPRVRRWIKKIGVDDEELAKIRKLWNHHAGKTMFFGKLSYGIAAAFVMIAGMVNMPLRKFIFYGSLVAIAHYWTLLFLGFYFGSSFGSISKVLENIGYVIGGATLILTAYYFIKKYINRKLKQAEAAEHV
jgi:membrane protein DedA with SNARE-associated domain